MTRQNPPRFARSTSSSIRRQSTLGVWSLPQFGRVVSLWLAAFLMLGIVWAGSSTDADPTHGGRWILLGLAGGLLAGVGSTGWILVGMRSVRARQQDVADRLAELGPALPDLLGVAEPVADLSGAAEDSSDLVRVADGTRYHRAHCPLVLGKSVVGVGAEVSALEPCGVCQP